MTPSYDCHRAYGPYAGVRDLLGRLAGAHPRLAARHRVELRAIVPHLARRSAGSPVTETIRFHPARRTAALAYGATEFLAAWARRLRRPATLSFGNVAEADETTGEMLDRLSHRIGSLPLRLELREGGVPPSPARHTPDELRVALGDGLLRGFYRYAARVARQGRALVTAEQDLPNWWAYTTGLATALAAVGEADEALDLYRQARATTGDPQITMSSASVVHSRVVTQHLQPTRHQERDRHRGAQQHRRPDPGDQHGPAQRQQTFQQQPACGRIGDPVGKPGSRR